MPWQLLLLLLVEGWEFIKAGRGMVFERRNLSGSCTENYFWDLWEEFQDDGVFIIFRLSELGENPFTFFSFTAWEGDGLQQNDFETTLTIQVIERVC